jgi:hypothetical protein
MQDDETLESEGLHDLMQALFQSICLECSSEQSKAIHHQLGEDIAFDRLHDYLVNTLFPMVGSHFDSAIENSCKLGTFIDTNNESLRDDEGINELIDTFTAMEQNEEDLIDALFEHFKEASD